MKKEESGQLTLDLMKERYPNQKVWEVSVQDLRTDDDESVNRTYFFGKPRRPDWSRMIQEISKKSEIAMHNFLLSAVLPESREPLTADLVQWPGLLATLSQELMGLLGANAVVSIRQR